MPLVGFQPSEWQILTFLLKRTLGQVTVKLAGQRVANSLGALPSTTTLARLWCLKSADSGYGAK
jgi:hypothetical protein